MPMPPDLPEKMVKTMNTFIEIDWLIPLAGVIEILAGVLFIIPRFRALGALMIFPIMIGILLTNLIAAPSGLPIALTLFAINIWIMIENREKYRLMF